ncbi:hypothetical protein FXO37_36303 [Capsicum annuum]|nr:hypothetical protein FXO37_36303 [Capsicum annuum]
MDREHRGQRVKMARWIADYISPLGDETPWIEGHGVIKKAPLIFAANFWWLIIRYRLFSTTSDNVLTLKVVSLIDSIMDEYAINFATILRHEIHDRSFGKAMNFPFSCLIQRLSDKVGVPEILRVDKVVLMIATLRMKTIKDLTCPTLPMRPSGPAIVP